MKISWKKDKKLEVLGALLGMNALRQHFFQPNTRRKNAKPLQQLALHVLQSKRYPKLVLSAAFASYVYPSKLEEWQKNSTVDRDVQIKWFENDIPFWFSYPELNQSTDEMLSRTLDCSHNLTHLRVLTCTKGFGNVSSDGWKACARSNANSLKIPLVEDIIDKQSVPNARTHFSHEVEVWLRENNFEEAANIANIVRNWYEASDTPGISSMHRVQQLVNMRKFLLRDIHFGEFPPKRRYINGIPIVTFQGMCIDIDTKLQLYGMTSSYNIRSVGSLAAETTVGVLQSLSPVSQVSIKARDVPALVSSLVEVMTCKINTDRGFHMRTSKLSGIYPVHEGNECTKDLSSISCPLLSPIKISANIVPRDNPFDKPEKRTVARKIKFGTISNPNEPARGALPVRQFHRKDESKILPTKRLGLSNDF